MVKSVIGPSLGDNEEQDANDDDEQRHQQQSVSGVKDERGDCWGKGNIFLMSESQRGDDEGDVVDVGGLGHGINLRGSWTRNVQPKPEKRPVYLVSLAFFFLFLSYNTFQNYDTLLLPGNLGNDSLAILYITVPFACFFGPVFIDKFGEKWSMAIGGSCYVVFLASLGYRAPWVVYISSIIIGKCKPTPFFLFFFFFLFFRSFEKISVIMVCMFFFFSTFTNNNNMKMVVWNAFVFFSLLSCMLVTVFLPTQY
eukprot:m.92460 g.92460  ORF g.92460 m.92460 type:complete len:253 (+) comp8891_c0_seq7:126-884(+)